MTSRFFATAPSPSSTCTITGPEVMYATRSLKNGALAVDAVERLGLGLRQLHHAGRDDAQAGLFEAMVDVADDVLADTVRLDDGKRAFEGHTDPWNDVPGRPACRL